MGNIIGAYLMPHPPIVIPEVGKGEERGILNTTNACMQIADEVSELKPDVILIITPHGPVFRDAVAISCEESIQGSLRSFGAPGVKFDLKINKSLTEAISKNAYVEGILTAKITSNSVREYNIPFELDHGSMVPLYFINQKYKDYELVHITYGALPKIDLYRFGMAVKKAIDESNLNVVVICSGDLSHRLKDDGPYGYNPNGEIYDREITKLLGSGDVLSIFAMDKKIVEGAGECGMRSIYTLLGILDKYSFNGELLSYEGPFGVGYGVMKIKFSVARNESFLGNLVNAKEEEKSRIKENEDDYVKLARKSLEYYVIKERYLPVPADLPDELTKNKRGVFVSLKIEGELRGCIGTTEPTTDSIAQEIIRNAVEAGEKDPRFFPVEKEELDELEYSVDVLMPAEKASEEDLDPKKYGVIVSKGFRSGLLLPDLEGVDTVDEQLRIALSKAGIKQSENYEIKRFEVVRHK